jgi:mono/diheme cytochrome c family protein
VYARSKIRSTPWLLALAALGCNPVDGAAGPSDDDAGEPAAEDAAAARDGGAPDAPLDDDGSFTGPVSDQPSRGSAVALSPDETRALIANRDVGSLSVLTLGGDAAVPTLTLSAELPLGAGVEPWQVAVAPSGADGYAVLRRSQELVRVGNLGGGPYVAGRASTGSEPTALALSPTGRRVYVASLADGTVVEHDAEGLAQTRTFDLNAALVATGMLGAVVPRPGLAHPRSIVISSNGDARDGDEYAYVTEYFAQQREAELADGSNADTRKVGLVYRIALGSGEVSVIELSSLADMGFRDQSGKVAGCYPNQLQAIALSGDFGYVSSVCASPEGPLGVKVTTNACSSVADCEGLSLVEPVCAVPAAGQGSVCVDVAGVKTTTGSLVSVFDLRTGREVEGSAVNLNAAFAQKFAALGLPAGGQRFPLFVSDLAFVPGTRVGYFAANGTDAVFRAEFDAETGKLAAVSASTSPFIDLAPAGIAPDRAGKNPIGIATLARDVKRALVANDVSRSATLLDFNTQAVFGGKDAPVVASTSALPAPGSDEDRVLRGKRFFNTGLGRWSLRGQGWGACQSCHGDGLTDNVTWYFARGPRQSVSLDGSFASAHPEDQRLFNWTAIFDEVADFENNTRGVSGGVGAIVGATSAPPATSDRLDLAALGHNGLGGSARDAADVDNPLGLDPGSKLADWDEIEAYVKAIRSPRAPSNLSADSVARGAELFADEGACAGCHGGEKWTVSRRFYTPSIAGNAALRTTPLTISEGFPLALLPAQKAENQLLRFDGGNAAAFDQILCALRPVDTFGVAEEGVGIAELRADMTTVAQGDGNPSGEGRGYNPPSLLGQGLGAPYLHAGQVRTLEALFSDTFSEHHQALAPNFLADDDPEVRAGKVSDLVQYLLAIDETTPYLALPAPGPRGGSLCGDTY